MRVMTFNLRCDFILDFNNPWKKRKAIVFDIMKRYDLDIIGVQEVTDKMYIDILENMGDYNIIGTARTKRIFVEKNDILVNKKHKIISHKTFWLSENTAKVGSSKWYSLYPRICTTCVIETNTGKRLRVCNSHLDCLLPQARSFGLKKLAETIQLLQEEEDLPLIIMGDFNATPESKVIKEFLNGTINNKRCIAVQEINKELYNFSTMSKFKGKEKGMHIDYIFVSEDIEIIAADIIKDNNEGKYPSDHYPIVAEVKI